VVCIEVQRVWVVSLGFRLCRLTYEVTPWREDLVRVFLVGMEFLDETGNDRHDFVT
jgi:hypothetical protein